MRNIGEKMRDLKWYLDDALDVFDADMLDELPAGTHQKLRDVHDVVSNWLYLEMTDSESKED